jgi:hypothetical protein
MTITSKQISLIHVAMSRLGLEDDDYRALLKRFGGVDSAKNLNQAGFTRMMDAFTSLGFRSDFQQRHMGERAGMASPRQVAMIRELWAEFTAGDGDDKSLGKWLERFFKVSSLRFVSATVAPKAITALKKMKATRMEKMAG